jgi:hypothetical protein
MFGRAQARERWMHPHSSTKSLKLLPPRFDNWSNMALNNLESAAQPFQGFGDCLSLRKAAVFSGGPFASHTMDLFQPGLVNLGLVANQGLASLSPFVRHSVGPCAELRATADWT